LDVDLTRIDFQGEIDPAAAEKELNAVPPPQPPGIVAGTLNASDDTSIRAAVGRIASIHGKVSQIGATNNGSVTFIDFEGTDRRRFTAIIRRDRLTDIAASFGGDLNTGITGKMVTVRGKVELYKETPQVAITRADQITVDPE